MARLRLCTMVWLLFIFFGLSICVAQTTGNKTPSPASPARTEESDTVAARKAAVQERLETLTQMSLSQNDIEIMRATLEQQLKALTALEVAVQKRAVYRANLARLPQQVQELNAELQALEARPPRRFPTVTEQLREAHEAQVQEARHKLEELHKAQVADDMRLTTIGRESEQFLAYRTQIEKELAQTRSETAEGSPQQPLLSARVELLTIRLQVQEAEMVMLEDERAWLSRQGPRQDAQVALAQARLRVLERELETIETELNTLTARQSTELERNVAVLTQRLQQTQEPMEILALHVLIETSAIQQATAAYRMQLAQVSELAVTQEEQNTREKQEAEHLATLVDKYASGEHVAQRLQAAFVRLQRERWRYSGAQVKTLESALNALVSQELALTERLYEFDRQVATRIAQVPLPAKPLTPEQRQAQLARVHTTFAEQKAALREQQHSLTEVVQTYSQVIASHRAYKRLLEDGYQFVLTKIFWLQDSPVIGLAVVQDAVAGAVMIARRLPDFVHTELAYFATNEVKAARVWVPLVLWCLGTPWAVVWIRRRIRRRVAAVLAVSVAPEAASARLRGMVLILVQTALWPAYCVLVVWLWTLLSPVDHLPQDVAPRLEMAFFVSAVVLWGWRAGCRLFGPQGWLQQAWQVSPEVCRVLHRTVGVSCLTVLLLLVPRSILLAIPGGEPQRVAKNLALARLYFMAFQLVLLALVGIVCRRGNPLMSALLAESRRVHGLCWRSWPLGYMALLAGMSAMLMLHLLGYRYAAHSLWDKSGQAALVIVVLLLLDYAMRMLIDRLARQRQRLETQGLEAPPGGWRSRLQQTRHFVRVLFVLIGLVVVQDLYGMSQGLFSALHATRLLDVGRTADGQILWLTLGDVTVAALILVSMVVLLRHLPGLYEVALFPRVQWDSGLRYTFLTLSRYALLFLGLWWGLSVLHMRWSSLQWIVAAVSVGVGFGLQEIVSNFVSGLILLIERPIRVDDIITVGEQSGVVKRITIRATAIQNSDNLTVIVPNKEFIAGRVVNWTLGETHVRLTLQVGVAYGSDLDLVKQLLTEVVTGHPRVLQTPPPMVLFRAFGDSALQWEIWCYVPRPQDRLQTAHDLLLHIEQAFRQHNITIPFPQRDLHLHSTDGTIVLQPSALQDNGVHGGQREDATERVSGKTR